MYIGDTLMQQDVEIQYYTVRMFKTKFRSYFDLQLKKN
jgi:hypothetical protein